MKSLATACFNTRKPKRKIHLLLLMLLLLLLLLQPIIGQPSIFNPCLWFSQGGGHSRENIPAMLQQVSHALTRGGGGGRSRRSRRRRRRRSGGGGNNSPRSLTRLGARPRLRASAEIDLDGKETLSRVKRERKVPPGPTAQHPCGHHRQPRPISGGGGINCGYNRQPITNKRQGHVTPAPIASAPLRHVRTRRQRVLNWGATWGGVASSPIHALSYHSDVFG